MIIRGGLTGDGIVGGERGKGESSGGDKYDHA
jgi:hypothetical protein